MGMAAILFMWYKPFELIFIPLPCECFTWNLASIGLAVSKEKKFENIGSLWTKVNEWLWPFIFIKLHVLIYLTASTNFDITDYNSFLKNNNIVLPFPIQKHKGPNLTLPYNRSRSTQGHHLNKLNNTRVPKAAYQISMSQAFWFRRRKF